MDEEERKIMAERDLLDYLIEAEPLLDHAVAAATVCNYFPDLFEGIYKLLVSLLENISEMHETTETSSNDQ